MLKKILNFVALFIFACGITLAYTQNGIVANAAQDEISYENVEEVETRGIFTSLSLSMDGGNGRVVVTAKNDLTIFPSTVRVIVELYCSDVAQKNYADMTLVAQKSIDDLNIGESISAEYLTGGKVKYWQGRMSYRIDNKFWEEKTTGTMKIDADGNFIENI